jgi:peptidyl-dipeptidase A
MASSDSREARTIFVARHVGMVEPLFRDAYAADWDAAIDGTEAAQERVAQLTAQLLKVYANAQDFATIKPWHEQPTGDQLLDRQVELLYLAYAGAQQDDETIEKLTALEKDVRSMYVNFRGVVDGRPLSDNEIGDILADSRDSAEVSAAWEASKQVGAQVVDRVLELVRLRNAAAQRMGYADHWQKDLRLAELREDALFDVLDALLRQTEAPFLQAKRELDATLAQRFGVNTDDLRPWHYGDPFFQRAPRASGGLDPLFEGKRLEDIAIKTFDAMGLDVRRILARSDLYERPGKNQHAFCTSIDRLDDVRILCNLTTTERWMETLLHELGHAVFDQYIDKSLPFLLRVPAHTLTTEAIAMLMGRLPLDEAWLREIAGFDAETVAVRLPIIKARQRLGMLIFVRWVLVMVHFERAMYADPGRDLNGTWWDLVERFQHLRRPEGRDAPDWASKIHLALYPVYYQNYMLGELTASHLRHAMTTVGDGKTFSAPAGAYLTDRVFRPGATLPWDERLKQATGEPLQPTYFVREFAEGT